LGIEPFNAAVLNLETLMLPMLDITHELTATVYINVFVPTELTKLAGVITPLLALSQLPEEEKVPVEVAATVTLFKPVALVQNGFGTLKDGTAKLTALTDMVFVIGQFTTAGTTVIE
jgi:hypothetical protein